AYDRFTFRRDVPVSEGPELFTFYLFTNVQDSSTVGAIFRISEFEPVDCCNLVNPGPLKRWDQSDLVSPYLMDSIYPADMSLAQQFTVLLYPQEDYSMVTTTWSADASGLYTWVALSAAGEAFVLNNPLIFEQLRENETVMFDFRTFHLPILLDEVDSQDMLGRAEVISGCGAGDISFRDDVEGGCDTLTLTRTYDYFVGEDFYEGACAQTIGMSHLGLDEVVLPPQSFQFTCSDTFPALDNGNPHPDFTGRPALYDLGVTQFIDEIGYAGIVATFSDSDSIRADGGRDVTRTWTLYDQCLDETRVFSQLFKLDAGGVAQFECPSSNHYCPIVEENIMLFSTDTFNCLADVPIPLPELVNICDTNNWVINTTVFTIDTLDNGALDTTVIAFFTIDDEDRTVPNLPLGDYFILYEGMHPDQLPQEVVCRFRVADVNEPVAICKSFVNLSLGGTGRTRVYTGYFDQGSYDNCDDFVLEVRRQHFVDPDTCEPYDTTFVWSEWEPYVEFTCCDVGSVFAVELRITDVGGNQNYCMTFVTVRDNTLPICTGLEDVTVTCEDLPPGFSPYSVGDLTEVFGVPDVEDNCSAEAIELEPIVTGTACAPERIVRQFLAIDEHGNEAAEIFEQVIDVTPTLHYAIHFPKDTETDCINNADTLRFELAGCDSITYTVIEAELPVLSNECRRVARTFTVTNWCEWDGVAEAVNINRDEDCDNTEGEEDVWVIRRPEAAYIDLDSLAFNPLPAAGIKGLECDGETNPEGHWRTVVSTGRWTYTQYVSIFDEVAPEIILTVNDSICTDSSQCAEEVLLAIDIFDACQVEEGALTIEIDLDDDGSIDVSGSLADGFLSGEFQKYHLIYDYPVGTHQITVTAIDDCGNAATVEQTITILDCFVPILTCNDGRLYNLEALSEITDIDGDGELEEAAVLVEAVELGSCDFTDCSGELRYSINRVGDTVDINRTSLYLDCNDRYQVDLEIYLWDNAFNPFRVQPDGSIGGPNWRSCTVTVLLQDPNLACANCQEEAGLTIAGRVRNAQNAFLPGVTMSVEQTGQSSMSSTTGRFQFLVPGGNAYTVHAYKNDDTREGLSTIDMVILQRHIIGTEIITDPYLLVAADINGDGSYSVQDMLQLQSTVLGAFEMFPSNTSWRFVPSDWNGDGPAPDMIQLGNLESCAFDNDLVGIKIGDLNGSYYAESGFANEATGRSPVRLFAQDQALTAGESYTVTLELPIDRNWQGGQISLRWATNALNYTRVLSPQLGPSCFRIHFWS
ncbi:MAG: hypothetical protein AAFU03_03325, partial [Bacteroidota bacterium]